MKIFCRNVCKINNMSENCSYVSIFDALSGYLDTEFHIIYSKIPITSPYIKRCNVEIMSCVDDVIPRPYGCV